MPILALTTLFTLAQDGRAAFDLLPFAPPPSTERFVAAADVAGVGEAWIVLAGADGARLARLAEGGFESLGGPVPFASGHVGSAQAFDLDRDGRASVFAVDGARLVELALDHRGRLAAVATLDLPGAFGAFEAPGVFTLDLPGAGEVAVELTLADGALALRPLWSGPARGFARLASGAVVAIDALGAAWILGAHEPRALAAGLRFESVLDGAWLVDAQGVLYRPVVTFARDASGAERVDVRLQPLVVEGGSAALLGGRLFDVDADGDLELVRAADGALFVHDGWGASGLRAPERVPTLGVSLAGAELAVLRADGRVWALAPHALAPFEVNGAGAAIDASATSPLFDAPLASRDVDRDGDQDLVAGGTYLANDGAGGFTPRATSHAARTLIVVERNGERTLLFEDGSGCFEQPVRADGSLGALFERDELSATSGFTLANARAVDLDGDGDDELVTPTFVFARSTHADEFRVVAVTPQGCVAPLEQRGQGSTALLVHDAAHGTLALARLVGTQFTLEPLASLHSAHTDAALLVQGEQRELLVVAGAGRLIALELVFGAAHVVVDVALPDAPVAGLASLAPDAPLHVAVSFVSGPLAVVDLATGALAMRHAPSAAHWCDVDGDQDLDLVAPSCGVVFGTRFDGALAGGSVQYGGGAPGSGDLTPLLGLAGPVRLGEPLPELRLSGALGGAKLYLAVTPDDWVLDLRRFGLSLTDRPDSLAWICVTLSGEADVPGAGEWVWHPNILSDLVGHTLRAQAFVADPRAVDGVSVSNRIAVTFGG